MYLLVCACVRGYVCVHVCVCDERIGRQSGHESQRKSTSEFADSLEQIRTRFQCLDCRDRAISEPPVSGFRGKLSRSTDRHDPTCTFDHKTLKSLQRSHTSQQKSHTSQQKSHTSQEKSPTTHNQSTQNLSKMHIQSKCAY